MQQPKSRFERLKAFLAFLLRESKSRWWTRGKGLDIYKKKLNLIPVTLVLLASAMLGR